MTLALIGLAVSLLAAGCGAGPAGVAGVEQVTSALVSSASLQLKVLTNSCGANQMQDFFQVVNTGTTAVKLSDIKIKYWADDTSGQALVPHVSTGGCASGGNGSPSCLHQVTGVTAIPTSFSPACGPDPTHQANWEITISDTDSTTLAAGATWNGIQTAVNLANFSNFTPGTGKWFSPCLAGSSYASDPHFALYYQGTLVFANGISAPACRSQGLQPVTGHLTPDILATPIIGPMPQTTVLHLGIGLPLPNPAAVDAQIAQVTDPTSPLYRHYLSVDDFTAGYGPSTSDHNNVIAWAQAKGLTVEHTYPNRRQVNVSGTVAAIEKALNVNMIFRRRPDGTTFWAPDREPSLDLAPPTVVSYINQLQNFFVPKRANGSAVDGSLLGSDYRRAYVPCLTSTANGAGQSIGLFGGDGFSLGSITSYAAAAGFNAPPVRAIHSDPNVVACRPGDHYCRDGSLCTGTCPSTYPCPASLLCGSNVACVAGGTCNDDNTVCGVSGCPADSGCATTGSVCPSTISGLDSAGSLEIHLDIEMAMSMAPGVTEIRVFQGANLFQDMATTTPLSFQLSSSWYFGPIDPIMRDAFREYQLQGQSFSLASGDFGPIKDPMSGANIDGLTLVGGTELVMNGNGNSYSSETAWGSSTGWIADGAGNAALSTPIPSYQTGIDMTAVGGSNLYRNAPDVSLPADHVYVVFPGGTGPIGGTSCASPMWAGFMALVNQQNQTNGLGPVGFANPVLYAMSGVPATYANDFNDILSDQTTGTAGITYKAFPGYDLTTGLGSPKCGMVKQLSSSSPAPNLGVGVGTEHACAIRSNHSVSCWGNNDFGQIGNTKATNPQLTPIAVSGLPRRVSALAAGGAHTCALLSDKTVWCWGSNGNGQLGTAGAASPSLATQIKSLSGVTAIASGSSHSCAILGDQTVQCWGENANGQLGNNSTMDSPSPVPVTGLTGVTSIAAGEFFNCAVSGADAHVSCWGLKFDVGNANPSDFQLTPTPVTLSSGAALSGVTAVAAGADHACALMQDSSVQCWGDNFYGEIGNLSDSPLIQFPTAVNSSCLSSTPMTGVARLALGWTHSCAVFTDGTASCWGSDTGGELGDGMTVSRECAEPVSSLTGLTAIAATNSMSCALSPTGVSCWGDGILGDGSFTGRDIPSTVRFF